MKLSYKHNTLNHVRSLGQGDFGSVALYETKDGTKQCIVKTIKDTAHLPFAKGQSKIREAKKALAREYKTHQRLRHAVGLRENGSQLVIEDPTLGTVLNQYEFANIAQLNNIFSTALDYLVTQIHSRDIIHYDIKLQNMIIDAKGKVEFIDYGSSEQVTESNAADESNADSTGIPLINLTALFDNAKSHVNATFPKLGLLEKQALIAKGPNSALFSYLNLGDFERLADGKTYDILALATAYFSALGLYQQRSDNQVTWQSVEGMVHSFKSAFEVVSTEAKALYEAASAAKQESHRKVSGLSFQSSGNRSGLFDSDSDSDFVLNVRSGRKKRKALSSSPLFFQESAKKSKLTSPRFIQEQARLNSASQMAGLSRSYSAGSWFGSSRRPSPNPTMRCSRAHSVELSSGSGSRRRLF